MNKTIWYGILDCNFTSFLQGKFPNTFLEFSSGIHDTKGHVWTNPIAYNWGREKLFCILNRVLLQFVPMGPINNNTTFGA